MDFNFLEVSDVLSAALAAGLFQIMPTILSVPVPHFAIPIPIAFGIRLIFFWTLLNILSNQNPNYKIECRTSRIWYGHVVSPTASSTYALSYLEFQ